MRRLFVLAVALLLGDALGAQAPPAPVDWNAQRAEILDRYRAILGWALDHRGLVLGGTLASFVAVMFLFGAFNHGVEFFPETQPRQIWASVETPPGTRLEQTDAIVRELERRLADLPDVQVVAAASGAGASGDEFSGGRSEGGDPTRGRVTPASGASAPRRSNRRRRRRGAGSCARRAWTWTELIAGPVPGHDWP